MVAHRTTRRRQQSEHQHQHEHHQHQSAEAVSPAPAPDHLDGGVTVARSQAAPDAQTADAADTDMSAGKLELVPRVAARIAQSAAAIGLSSIEVWVVRASGDGTVGSGHRRYLQPRQVHEQGHQLGDAAELLHRHDGQS